MDVGVRMALEVVVVAQLVFYGAGTVIHGVHHGVGGEDGERACYRGAVHRLKGSLNIHAAHGSMGIVECAEHQQPDGRYPDACIFQQLLQIRIHATNIRRIFVHTMCMNGEVILPVKNQSKLKL